MNRIFITSPTVLDPVATRIEHCLSYVNGVCRWAEAGSWMQILKGFFDTIDHTMLRETIKKRINDGGIIRLIGKWLNAGVLEGESVIHPE
jgi:hypothetical protein